VTRVITEPKATKVTRVITEPKAIKEIKAHQQQSIMQQKIG
jgi:hypothetical protein